MPTNTKNDAQILIEKELSAYNFYADIEQITEQKKKEILGKAFTDLFYYNPSIPGLIPSVSLKDSAKKALSYLIPIKKTEMIFARLMAEGLLYPVGLRKSSELVFSCEYTETSGGMIVTVTKECRIPIMIYEKFARA